MTSTQIGRGLDETGPTRQVDFVKHYEKLGINFNYYVFHRKIDGVADNR